MRALLDLVFPPRCAGCDAPGILLCDECRSAVVRIDPAHACPRCGAPLGGRAVCAECRGARFAFSAARCAATLEPPVSRAVVLLKDGGERRYAGVVAELLAGCAEGWLDTSDVLVPVPASPSAVRRRGFDHAADIAREFGRNVGLPVERPLRATRGADQRALGRSDRFANRQGAFEVDGECRIRQAVLIDDVFTTGATFDAAAHALAAAGVSRIRALAVARSV